MTWDDGDFNYDGTVNAEDFTLISNNFGQQSDAAAAVTPIVGAPIVAAASLAATSLINSSASSDTVSIGVLESRSERKSVTHGVLDPDKKAVTSLRQHSSSAWLSERGQK